MDILASFYPALSLRQPYPVLYLPLTFAVAITPFLFCRRRLVAACVFPILLLLCIYAPCYTFDSPTADYYNSSVFIAMPIWFAEFAIFRPRLGRNAPVFVGDLSSVENEKPRQNGRTWDDLGSVRERIFWAFSLMIPSHRGIGWNWQVKNVPQNLEKALPKWTYVEQHLKRFLLAYVQSTAMLLILGCGSKANEIISKDYTLTRIIVDSIIGWSGAIWVWSRLCCFYNFLAAVSVTFGICETWEWPPLMGDLHDAWSVRQMWSVVYHQTMRMMVSQPALRITRLLGLRKGSFASRYTQLFGSFAISCVVHQFQMFNVTRRDMGEFSFFMSQPIAILAEDIAQWWWQQVRGPNDQRLGTFVGYLWIVLWFSFSLPYYVKGFRDAGITRDFVFGSVPYDVGSTLAVKVLVS